jgi:hypothetical protein
MGLSNFPPVCVTAPHQTRCEAFCGGQERVSKTAGQRNWKPSKGRRGGRTFLGADGRITSIVVQRSPGAVGQKASGGKILLSQKRADVKFHFERLKKTPALCARRERKPIDFFALSHSRSL